MSNKWSLRKAAIYGLVLGAPMLWARDLLFRDQLPSGIIEFIGYSIGGAIAGAALFVIVASIRNWPYRSQP